MKSQIAENGYVPGTSRGPRNVRTLLLQMAADKERQEEIGARIRELRGRRPQPTVADAVGVTLRAYQAWEAGDSGIAWDNLVKLAEHFGVSEDYIEYGESGRSGPSTQLDRIEEKLDILIATLQGKDGVAATVERLVTDLAAAGALDADARPPAGSSPPSSGKRAAPRQARARGSRKVG